MKRLPALSIGLLLACMAMAPVRPAHAQWGWRGGYHASTVAEGYQRGMADVVRSAGAANLMESAAAQNLQEAESRALDNRLKTTETYFENRKMNKAYRAELKTPSLSREAMYRIARDAAPKRLSPAEFDPVTGELSFPLVLQDPVFNESNQKLQELFRERSQGGARGLKAMQQIDATTKQVRAELASRIRLYPSSAYLEAQNFLRSLAFEAQSAG